MDKCASLRFRPQLCLLEEREVPAVASVQPVNGVLDIRTDSQDSVVVINQNDRGFVRVTDTVTNRSWAYSAAQVRQIRVVGGAGNDRFVATGPANARPVFMYGGAGNDTLRGTGAGRIIAYGGGGNDRLIGGASNDRLFGGAGHDWIHGGAGNDYLNGGASHDWIHGGSGSNTFIGGLGNDDIIAINDSLGDVINPGPGWTVVWIDRNGTSQDTVTGTLTTTFINAVDAFRNPGADRTLDGDRLPDPALLPPSSTTTFQYERFTGRPLFGPQGPTINDIQQGALGDCWFLASLGSIAYANPQYLRTMVVDFGDGTYGVRFGDQFYRVDDDLPVSRYGDQFLSYTAFGLGGSMWAPVIEKAFAFHRTPGANSYSSIEGGFTIDAFNTFQLPDAGAIAFRSGYGLPSFVNAASLGYGIKNLLYPPDPTRKYAIAIGIDTSGSPMLLNEHQYIVTGVELDGMGAVTYVHLRNPWRIDGGTVTSGNPNDGDIRISIDELYASSGFTTLEYARVDWPS